VGAGQPGAALGSHWFAGLAAVGVILAAVYILLMFRKYSWAPSPKMKTATCVI